MKLDAKLFGIPRVTADGRELSLPYKKADALLYYLLTRRHATRGELIHLLWEGADPATALKNLRHAVYSIRKALGCDPFDGRNRTVLQFSEAVEISCDVWAFTESDALEACSGDFLEDFVLPRSDAFDEWMTDERVSLHTRYLKLLLAAQEQAAARGDWAAAERYGLSYIDSDPLDETAVRLLMQAYRAQRRFRKAISLYDALRKGLTQEFSVAPMRETTALYYEIMSEWNHYTDRVETRSVRQLVGRGSVLRGLLALCNGARTKEKRSCAFLRGEAGVGKTYLLDYLLEEYDFSDRLVLRTACYPSGVLTMLEPWQTIMLQLVSAAEQAHIRLPEGHLQAASDIFPALRSHTHAGVSVMDDYPVRSGYAAALESALLLLADASRQAPVLLVIEDVHCLDADSAHLLSMALHRLNESDVTLICTGHSHLPPYVQQLLEDARRDRLLEEYTLADFTREETEDFLRGSLSIEWTEDAVERIYRNTRGNAMLLVQLLGTIRETGSLESIPDSTESLLRGRISALSEEERSVLDAVSVFTLQAPARVLSPILSVEPLALMSLCAQLQQKALLTESAQNGELFYAFAGTPIRDAFVKTQPESCRRILHLRTAQYLEAEPGTPGLDRYVQLVRHYTAGGDRFKAFAYRVRSLSIFVDMCYELLPTLSGSFEIQELSEESFPDYLDGLLSELASLRTVGFEAHLAELDALERDLLYAAGRYYVHEGLYEQGLPALDRLTAVCDAAGEQLMSARAHLQYVFYAVQTCDFDVMREHLDLGMQLRGAIESTPEWGGYLRLNGLYFMMRGRQSEARIWFERSIDAFRALERENDGRYTINIAGAYNYIGETYRLEGDFQTAYEYYDQAIVYNKSFGRYPGAAIFYTDYGIAAFQDGNPEVARELLLYAERLYSSSHEYSHYPIALSYLAYFDAEDGNWSAAAERLKKAFAISEALRSPWWMGVATYMSWKLRRLAERRHCDAAGLEAFWPADEAEHCRQALRCLRRMEPRSETEELEQRLRELTGQNEPA